MCFCFYSRESKDVMCNHFSIVILSNAMYHLPELSNEFEITPKIENTEQEDLSQLNQDPTLRLKPLNTPRPSSTVTFFENSSLTDCPSSLSLDKYHSAVVFVKKNSNLDEITTTNMYDATEIYADVAFLRGDMSIESFLDQSNDDDRNDREEKGELKPQQARRNTTSDTRILLVNGPCCL